MRSQVHLPVAVALCDRRMQRVVVAIEPNQWFATIADLARHVAENRRTNNI